MWCDCPPKVCEGLRRRIAEREAARRQRMAAAARRSPAQQWASILTFVQFPAPGVNMLAVGKSSGLPPPDISLNNFVVLDGTESELDAPVGSGEVNSQAENEDDGKADNDRHEDGNHDDKMGDKSEKDENENEDKNEDEDEKKEN